MNENTYKIKGLVWAVDFDLIFEQYKATTQFGNYYIQRQREWTIKGVPWGLWQHYTLTDERVTIENPEEGKAKAEADWLARILPASEEVKEGE